MIPAADLVNIILNLPVYEVSKSGLEAQQQKTHLYYICTTSANVVQIVQIVYPPSLPPP